MLDTDELVCENIERLLPIAKTVAPDWDDVLARGGLGHGRPHRLLLVVALTGAAALLATLAFTPVGSAVTRGWNDFSAWVSGGPGDPASPEEQRTFEQSERGLWSAFPGSPKLRRLIVSEIDGIRYRLFGYRIGDSFCLRLLSDASPADPAIACAPLSELERADAPAVVLLADYGFASGSAANGESPAPSAQATFGITTDAVTRITVAEASGEAQIESSVASNAFLIVAARPEQGYRVQRVTAQTRGGGRVAISVAEAPFDRRVGGETSARATGPADLERQLNGGTVRWIERRELRGTSMAEARLPTDPLRPFESSFARIVQPDPQSRLRVAVALGTSELLGVSKERPDLCIFLVTQEHLGGGCSPLRGFFSAGPISVSQSLINGGDQFVGIVGLVSDDVSRLELFLANHERIAVPVRDNAFVASAARAKYPVRLVAYDADGKVVGISTLVDPISG